MPIKEGRCPNCGSILQLSTQSEKGHCLFCDAVFTNREAFDIAESPSAYTFPNLPQAKYEGPSLDPAIGSGGDGSAQAQKAKKKPKPPPPVVYVPKEPVKLPDIRLPGKTKLRIFLISLVTLLVISGISAPLIIRRDTARGQLIEAMSDIAPFPVNPEQGVSIWNMSNNLVMIAAFEPVNEAGMIRLFRNYCEKRAMIQGINPADFARTYGSVTVKLVTPEGGYLISKPKSAAELDNGTAITRLP
jgi:hypothetical protein